MTDHIVKIYRLVQQLTVEIDPNYAEGNEMNRAFMRFLDEVNKEVKAYLFDKFIEEEAK